MSVGGTAQRHHAILHADGEAVEGRCAVTDANVSELFRELVPQFDIGDGRRLVGTADKQLIADRDHALLMMNLVLRVLFCCIDVDVSPQRNDAGGNGGVDIAEALTL